MAAEIKATPVVGHRYQSGRLGRQYRREVGSKRVAYKRDHPSAGYRTKPQCAEPQCSKPHRAEPRNRPFHSTLPLTPNPFGNRLALAAIALATIA
jgi:hypothetical protein